MKPTVLSNIVKNDLCIGCGVCAGICPERSLEIWFNQFGEYNPIQNNPCSKECGLCMKVCPFAYGNDNEDTIGTALYGSIPRIQHREEIGYYLNSYVGYALATRARGSSGGMATWLLMELLKKGVVEYVIAVVPNDDPKKLFKFSILTNPENITSAFGSAYYPVELSELLREIQNKPGSCAIIGLPCFIKAIRLAQKNNGKLRQRIAVTLGLACGQLKGKHFTEYIASLAGANGIITSVRYRNKSSDQPASNFYFSFMSSGKNEKRIFWKDGISEVWENRWFTPTACNYCDDIFAECADITFLDAWLPKYSSDPRGTNLIIVRSQRANEILREGIKSSDIEVNDISIDDVIRSQEGVISIKREHLAYRLYRAHQQGVQMPMKRVKSAAIMNPLIRMDIEFKEKMQQESRNNFSEKILKDDFYNQAFRQSMTPYLKKIRLLRKVSAGLSLPLVGFRKIKRYIHG